VSWWTTTAESITLDRIAHERAEDIYAAHQNLWGVTAYVASDVGEAGAEKLLAFLGWKLGVEFLDATGKAGLSVIDLLLREIADMGLSDEELASVRRDLRADVVAAHGGDVETFDDRLQRAKLLAQEQIAARATLPPPG
jgi:hypothetical protein